MAQPISGPGSKDKLAPTAGLGVGAADGTGGAAGKTPAAPDLDVLVDMLSFYLRAANHAVSCDLDARLTGLEVASGTGKITTLLLIDSHPGIRPSTIAAATLRDRPSHSRIIAPMIAAGLIEQCRAPGEGRAWELFIAPRGYALAEDVRRIVKAQSEEFFAPLSEADRAHLLRILRRVYHIARKAVA